MTNDRIKHAIILARIRLPPKLNINEKQIV